MIAQNRVREPVPGDRRISGPMLSTHTKNDKAEGIASRLTSRISRHVASALGDENDPYGGLGRSGAQRTPEAKEFERPLRAVGEDYSFQRNRGFNLRAKKSSLEITAISPAIKVAIRYLALHHCGVVATAWIAAVSPPPCPIAPEVSLRIARRRVQPPWRPDLSWRPYG